MPNKGTATRVAPSGKRPRRAAAAAVASTKRVSNWSFRVAPDTQRLIDAAAEAVGSSRTEFVLRSARERATEVLLDNHLFTLSQSDWNGVMRALDDPLPANAKLKELLAARPTW